MGLPRRLWTQGSADSPEFSLRTQAMALCPSHIAEQSHYEYLSLTGIAFMYVGSMWSVSQCFLLGKQRPLRWLVHAWRKHGYLGGTGCVCKQSDSSSQWAMISAARAGQCIALRKPPVQFPVIRGRSGRLFSLSSKLALTSECCRTTEYEWTI